MLADQLFEPGLGLGAACSAAGAGRRRRLRAGCPSRRARRACSRCGSRDRRPGRAGRAAAAASSLLRRLRAKTLDGVALGALRQLPADLALQARHQQAVQGVVGRLLAESRACGCFCSASVRAAHSAAGCGGAGGAVRGSAAAAFGSRRRLAASASVRRQRSRRRRRAASAAAALRPWRRRPAAAQRRRFARQRQRQAFQGDAPAGLGVPLQLDRQGVLLLAAVDGQDAVRRDVADRLGELEVVLVLQPLPFGEFLALGCRQNAGVPQDGAQRRRARRRTRRSSRRGCAARRPARLPACSAPFRG